MGDIRPNGITVPIKSNYDSKTSNANESNIENRIKALKNEFDITSKTSKVETIGETKN